MSIYYVMCYIDATTCNERELKELQNTPAKRDFLEQRTLQKTDLCKLDLCSFCSVETVWSAAKVSWVAAVFDHEASPFSILGPLIKKEMRTHKLENLARNCDFQLFSIRSELLLNFPTVDFRLCDSWEASSGYLSDSFVCRLTFLVFFLRVFVFISSFEYFDFFDIFFPLL